MAVTTSLRQVVLQPQASQPVASQTPVDTYINKASVETVRSAGLDATRFLVSLTGGHEIIVTGTSSVEIATEFGVYAEFSLTSESALGMAGPGARPSDGGICVMEQAVVYVGPVSSAFQDASEILLASGRKIIVDATPLAAITALGIDVA